ncbi:MAG: leucyl/phenylalanyl-tRNA--protein transferase [Candidatus Obscuribacterales bacterium]|nr:leucyl/phenylalanyl-tRNA--protein transferase [Candidatus Obscuribacterales bacterium]
MANELTPDLLLQAYANGIFPMGDSHDPKSGLRWYAPDPRCIIDLDNFHASARLYRTYKQDKFKLRVNTAWAEVVQACASREETWITDEIFQIYSHLHKLGYAHSVEVYFEEKLVGGLYGVSIGGAFMGESMFHTVRDASKIALLYLVERLKERGFSLLDCQFMTEHLRQFGAINISRDEYTERLNLALAQDCHFADLV